MRISASRGFIALGICCAYCGDQATTIDHILPSSWATEMSPTLLAAEGLESLDDPRNLAPACHSCNCSKADLSIDEWVRRMWADRVSSLSSPARLRVWNAILDRRCADWFHAQAAATMNCVAAETQMTLELVSR
jgi:hypothetical protein